MRNKGRRIRLGINTIMNHTWPWTPSGKVKKNKKKTSHKRNSSGQPFSNM